MAFNTKYQIPDFQLHEVIREHYGYDLKPAQENSYYCKCPLHNHSPAGERALRVWDHGEEGFGGWVCPRGVSGNAWDFFNEALGLPLPESDGFDQTVEFVCEALGVEPQTRGSYQETPTDRAQSLLRDIESALRPVSFSEPNKHWTTVGGRNVYRGIDPLTWLEVGVGILPVSKREAIEDSYTDADFEAAGITPFKRSGYSWLSEGVVVMRKSTHGVPKGLAVRRYQQMGGSEPKYVKNSSGSSLMDTSSYVFGVDGLEEDPPVVWVVEGEFDALALRLRGVNNVLTYGSGVPSDGQVETIASAADHAIYVADNDANGAGFQHAAKVAKRLPSVEVTFPPTGDPEEFVRSEGVEALKDCPRYTARQTQMIDEPAYDWDERQWTSRRKVLAKRYMEKVVENPSVFDEEDVKMISVLSGVDQEYLTSWLFYRRNMRSAKQMAGNPAKFEPGF